MKDKNNLINCKDCDYETKAKKGICFKMGSDGLPVMCLGDWTGDKHFYLEKYLHIFSQGMSGRWKGNLYYLDLFCGPGRSLLRGSGKEADGSPLIALRYNFAGYFFVDIMAENIKALQQRCKGRSNSDKAKFVSEDSNKTVMTVRKQIPEYSLSVAFIDPFGLGFDFSSYVKLTEGRKVDLIINFPLGTAIKRNWKKSTSERSRLNDFLGGDNWRPIKGTVAFHFINYFRKNLEKIGYKEFVSPLSDVVIKTKKNKVPLYYLLFASKHKRGNEFWNKIMKYGPNGQKTLF